jgi:hypothetical protein
MLRKPRVRLLYRIEHFIERSRCVRIEVVLHHLKRGIRAGVQRAVILYIPAFVACDGFVTKDERM